MSLAVAAARSLGLVAAALVLAVPLAALTGIAIDRSPAARLARACLRALAALPIAVLGLCVARGAGLGGLSVALLALALGAYAPLALEIVKARAELGAATSVQALALGLSPRRVGTHLVWPAVRSAVLAALLRVGARLVGEAGLFLWLAAEGTRLVALAPLALAPGAAQGAATLTLVLALGLAALAARVEQAK